MLISGIAVCLEISFKSAQKFLWMFFLSGLPVIKFRDICNKYKLTNYLSGGTFLGAVRHQGFIPWDDDIDVAMPREDYDKFTLVVQKELPQYMTFKSIPLDENYHVTWSRIINNDVKVIVHNYKNDEIEPAWIDIFTLDGMPSSRFDMNIHKIRLLWRRVTYGWANYKYVSYNKKNRPWYERFHIFIGRTIKPGRWMTIQKEYEKLENALRKYPSADSKYYMNFKGTYMFNSIMEKEIYYGDGALYEFEWEYLMRLPTMMLI